MSEIASVYRPKNIYRENRRLKDRLIKKKEKEKEQEKIERKAEMQIVVLKTDCEVKAILEVYV